MYMQQKSMCKFCSSYFAALKHLNLIACGSYAKQAWLPLAYIILLIKHLLSRQFVKQYFILKLSMRV